MSEREIIYLLLNCSEERDKEFERVEWEDVNWNRLFEQLVANRMLLYGYSVIKNYIPDKYRKLFLEKVTEYQEIIIIQERTIMQFSDEAAKRNVGCFFIKGIILSAISYGNIFSRDPGDIDIIIKESDLTNAKQIMNKIGFLRTYFKDGRNGYVRIKEPTSNKMGVFHELVFSTELESKITCAEIKIYTSAIRKRYMNEFWDNRQVVRVGKVSVQTSNLLYTFVHMLSNTYGNTERRFNIEDRKFILRDYLDLISFIRKYGTDIDWREVKNISERMQITHKVRNVLININSLVSHLINDEILQIFGLDKVSYELFCENDGATVNWQMSLLERMLNKEAAVLEYRKLYMNRLLSNKNKFFSSQYLLGNYEENDYQIVATSEDAGIPVKYKYWKKNDEIIITIMMSKDELEYFIAHKMHIEFHMFCCNEAYSNIKKDIHKILKLGYMNGRFCFACDGIQIKTSVKEICGRNQEENYIEISLNRKYIFGDSVLVPYNIFIFETEIEGTVPILTGVRFSEVEDEEETTDMEVINLG